MLFPRDRRRGGLPGPSDDDDVYHYICWRLKLEGETGNMGVWGGEERKVGVSEEHTYQVRERRWFVLGRPRRDHDVNILLYLLETKDMFDA